VPSQPEVHSPSETLSADSDEVMAAKTTVQQFNGSDSATKQR
jgi:hypothetical protein